MEMRKNVIKECLSSNPTSLDPIEIKQLACSKDTVVCIASLTPRASKCTFPKKLRVNNLYQNLLLQKLNLS